MNPVLTADDIHLWLVDLDQPLTPLPELAATLTADEQERAGRFRFPEHQARFIAGRGLLRELLSGYLNRPAAALRFRRGLHGKPELAGEEAAARTAFQSVAQWPSGVVCGARREVGVDLEKLDRSADYAGIMARICGTTGTGGISDSPSRAAPRRFFRLLDPQGSYCQGDWQWFRQWLTNAGGVFAG
jgi:4'-phosphopantetheinyl transferase